jgi:hypothetical protein
VDYRAGDRHGRAAAAFEEHLFACGDCARRLEELEALARGVGRAVRSGAIATIVDEAVLNRLARDGVGVRSFALSPGDTVPCAVWEGDEVMALRLRGNFKSVRSVTVVQRLAGGGREIARAQHVPVGRQSEIILAMPAETIREMPAAQLDIRVTGHAAGGSRRLVGAYTLQHGGSLRREARREVHREDR